MTALGVIGFQVMATHQVAHAVDRGFPPATVVWVFTLGAACMMAGNLLGGWLSDHVGREWVFGLGSIVAIVGIGCLALTRGPHDLPLLLVYTVSGIGFGMRIAQLSAIPADAFSGPHLGAIPRRGPGRRRPRRSHRSLPRWLALRPHRNLRAWPSWPPARPSRDRRWRRGSRHDPAARTRDVVTSLAKSTARSE
jgi:hypothetical protein